MADYPGEGFHDLSRRLRIVWCWVARARARRALYRAETELGWLGWEQVDFFDAQTTAQVKAIQEFENTQASLMNTTAELSGRKALLDDELAREKALHDQAQAALAEERAPFAASLDQAETARRRKLEAVERFNRALEELDRLEKKLQARSAALMKVADPTPEIRVEARGVSDGLSRLPEERRLVLADRLNASQEAARLEIESDRVRADLDRIDSAAAAARDRLAAATRRLAGEARLLEREQKKSSLHMSHLDREKRKPYQIIGACLADHGIAPLNQPAILDTVLALRERDAHLTETLAALQAACAGATSPLLFSFYLLLAAILFAIAAIGFHFVHS